MPAPVQLLDLLICPDCGGGVRVEAAQLRCRRCGIDHPMEAGTPFLLPKHQRGVEVEHEFECYERSTFPAGVERTLAALGRDQLVLDIGSGDRVAEDPRIVLADLRYTPRVDVVSDAHHLPFRDASFDLVVAGAVFEHLVDPRAAAREIWRVLKPGGQVIADCSFVFPFHGFPASYFHMSGEGLKRVFADFRAVTVEASPWLMPSYSLEAIVCEWLRLAKPTDDRQREFLAALRQLGRFDARAMDGCFDQEAAMRLSAGNTFFGLKQPNGDESVVPAPAMALWRRDEELQRRFPDPAVLLPTMRDEHVETFLHWAADEGRRRDPAIAAWYDERPDVRRDSLRCR